MMVISKTFSNVWEEILDSRFILVCLIINISPNKINKISLIGNILNILWNRELFYRKECSRVMRNDGYYALRVK